MTVAAVRAARATKTTTMTAIGGCINNNQLMAIRGSKRNGGGDGSGDSGDGNVNSDINPYGDDDSNDANPDALRTPPEAFFAFLYRSVPADPKIQNVVSIIFKHYHGARFAHSNVLILSGGGHVSTGQQIRPICGGEVE
jgi:hypothetical protein